MIIGDFTGLLYTVIAILAVLLACCGGALLFSAKASHPKPAAKSAHPKTSTGVPQPV
ncbi:MAG: hypothetical protein AB1384_00125 [Actinomycetota bacterium]